MATAIFVTANNHPGRKLLALGKQLFVTPNILHIMAHMENTNSCTACLDKGESLCKEEARTGAPEGSQTQHLRKLVARRSQNPARELHSARDTLWGTHQAERPDVAALGLLRPVLLPRGQASPTCPPTTLQDDKFPSRLAGGPRTGRRDMVFLKRCILVLMY